MAKLTAAKRNALPPSKFADKDRSYPVDTRARAADAKSRASGQYHEGNLSKSAMQKIDAKANKVLKKGK